jgi:hypothetical protein
MLADELDHVIGVDPHRDTHVLAVTVCHTQQWITSALGRRRD